jgi:hypothetical protein
MENIEKIKYVEFDKFISRNRISFKNIDDFESFINNNQMTTVFYGIINTEYNNFKDEIIHSESCFLVVFDSLMYTFTYELKEGCYKTIQDYKDGNSKGFINSKDYYHSIENELKNQDEETYYKKSLFLSVKDYKDALEHGFVGNESEGKYGLPIIGLIKKEDLQNNIYYANAAFSIYLDRNFTNPNGGLEISYFENKNLNEFIESYKERKKINSFYGLDKDKLITEYNDYFFVYLNIRLPTAYGKYEKEESAFFYYTRFAQHDSLTDFINSRVKSEETFNLSNHGFYIMKNTNNILNEMNKNKCNDFFESEEFKLLTSVLPDPRYIYKK